MLYYSKENIVIRDLKKEDIIPIVNGEVEQGWHSTPKKLEKRLLAQKEGRCLCLVATIDDIPAGYIFLYWKAKCGPYASQNIPEIVDFNVLEKYRKKGIGSNLLDVIESIAFQKYDAVSLAVGLHSGYGQAQRLYVKRGYIPDGSGVWYKESICAPYSDTKNDDDLVLYMLKNKEK